MPGADFTITRGNNVYAYEDASDNNTPGQSADGGDELNFDFPLNISNNPDTYQDAAITNLFYANNVIHDILYAYGFDEASGNFQDNNYGNGGNANDEVRAEAQDGGGFNNATHSNTGDGSPILVCKCTHGTQVLPQKFHSECSYSYRGVIPFICCSIFRPWLSC